MLISQLALHLTDDDDVGLWELVTNTLLKEAETASCEVKGEIFVEIGCCAHWISPHRPLRWKAGGGLAWPFGYDKTTTGFSYRALPAFEWSETFRFSGGRWEPAEATNRGLVFRISVPARTARHRQAAIHTIWTPRSPDTREKRRALFGFRRSGWRKWWLTTSQILR
jgi:hypothetical protein